MGNTSTSIQALQPWRQRREKLDTPTARAEQVLIDGSYDAARSIVAIASNTAAKDCDRLAASRDVLDRCGVGKRSDVAAEASISLPLLTAALAGIAALAGRDMSQFGDMTDLQDRLESVSDNIAATAADYEVVEQLSTPHVSAPLPATTISAAATLRTPHDVALRKRRSKHE